MNPNFLLASSFLERDTSNLGHYSTSSLAQGTAYQNPGRSDTHACRGLGSSGYRRTSMQTLLLASSAARLTSTSSFSQLRPVPKKQLGICEHLGASGILASAAPQGKKDMTEHVYRPSAREPSAKSQLRAHPEPWHPRSFGH